MPSMKVFPAPHLNKESKVDARARHNWWNIFIHLNGDNGSVGLHLSRQVIYQPVRISAKFYYSQVVPQPTRRTDAPKKDPGGLPFYGER